MNTDTTNQGFPICVYLCSSVANSYGIATMQVNDDLIRGVVQQVLAQMRNGHAPASRNGHASKRGVFQDVESAVKAASAAQKEFEARGLEDRRKAVACIRRICSEQAEQLGREELEETKIGRLPHK